MNSAPTITISRFILNLRRSAEKGRTADSRFSHFSASRFRVPSFAEFVGEMGQPLDYGVEDAEEPQNPRTTSDIVGGPSRVHADAETKSDAHPPPQATTRGHDTEGRVRFSSRDIRQVTD